MSITLYFVYALTTSAIAERYSNEYLAQLPHVNYSLSHAFKSDITYQLYNSSNTEGIMFNENNVNRIYINKSLPTKLLAHGFISSPQRSPWFHILRDEYFAKGRHNIIYLDWSKAANLTYLVSSANVKPVGLFVAEFLVKLGIPVGNVHLIGHSLGSHLTGFIGKYVNELTGQKIGRITALDPAGPGFEHASVESYSRLCSKDADFVDVIHTDIGHYGFSAPLGHVDFYPNNGNNQPKWRPEHDDDNYDHATSTHYFIESVNNRGMKAKMAHFENGRLHMDNITNDEVIFGDGTPKTTRGVYSLKINLTKPYPFLRTGNRNN